MKHSIQLGQFSRAMLTAVENSVPGDIILVPTQMHLHALSLILADKKPAKEVKLQLIESVN